MKREFTRSTVINSFLISSLVLLMYASGAVAQVTGEFKDVSFWATDGGRKFEASGGSGVLKNADGAVIAEGKLTSPAGLLAINGKKGASFSHTPSTQPFNKEAWPKEAPREIAEVALTEGSRWTLKDERFLFVLEVPALNRPQIVPVLDKSLARASVITLPKGKYNLWGYPINVSKDAGIVKFRHGFLINMTDASFDDTDTRHMLLYDKGGTIYSIGRQKVGFGGGLSGMFDGVTLLIGEGAGGDRALAVLNGEKGPVAVGGFITSEGDRVVFDDKGKVTSRIGGFWKPQGESGYAISLRDADGKDLAIARLTKEVRWDTNGEITKGADAFVEVGLKSPENKEGKFSKVIESKCEKGVVTIKAEGGLTLQISGFSYNHVAEAKQVK